MYKLNSRASADREHIVVGRASLLRSQQDQPAIQHTHLINPAPS